MTLKIVRADPDAVSRSIEDYLVACRSRGVKPSTIRFGYGFPLRSVFLPWCREHGIESPADLDKRTVERYAAELRTRKAKTGKALAENTVWTYIKSLNQYVAWLAAENGEKASKIRQRKPPARKVDVLERDQVRARSNWSDVASWWCNAASNSLAKSSSPATRARARAARARLNG